MEPRLKQRLIGASVLIAVAVIVVPELVRKPQTPFEQPAIVSPVPTRPEVNSEGMTLSLPTPKPVEPPPPAAVSNDAAVPNQPRLSGNSTAEVVNSRPLAQAQPLPDMSPSRLPPAAAVEPEPAPAPKPKPAPRVVEPEPAPKPKPAPRVVEAEPAPKSKPTPRVAEPEPVPKATAVTKPTPKPTPRLAEAEAAAKPAPKPTPRLSEPAPTKPSSTAPMLPKIELVARPSTATANRPPAAVASAPNLPPVSAQRRFTVQVGSYSLEQNANAVRDQLRGGGMNARVERIQAGGQALYRVRIGPQNSVAQSERIRSAVQGLGLSASVVPLD